MDSELEMLNSIHGEFYSNGISSMDTSVGIIHGRPYGGLVVLYRRSIASSCNFINLLIKMIGLKEWNYCPTMENCLY